MTQHGQGWSSGCLMANLPCRRSSICLARRLQANPGRRIHRGLEPGAHLCLGCTADQTGSSPLTLHFYPTSMMNIIYWKLLFNAVGVPLSFTGFDRFFSVACNCFNCTAAVADLQMHKVLRPHKLWFKQECFYTSEHQVSHKNKN